MYVLKDEPMPGIYLLPDLSCLGLRLTKGACGEENKCGHHK